MRDLALATFDLSLHYAASLVVPFSYFSQLFFFFVTDFLFGPSIQVHALLVCLATEWVQQSHSASAASLITSSVPNLLLTYARPSPICSLSAAVPRGWEKLHSIGVELKAHHHQRRL